MARRLTLNLDTPAFQSTLPQAPVLKNWRELLVNPAITISDVREALERVTYSPNYSKLTCVYDVRHPTIQNIAPLALFTNLSARLLIPDQTFSRIAFNRIIDSWRFMSGVLDSRKMVIGWESDGKGESSIDDTRLRNMTQMEFVQQFSHNKMLQIYSLLQATHYLIPDTRPATDGIDCYLAPGGFYLLMSILKQEMHSIG